MYIEREKGNGSEKPAVKPPRVDASSVKGGHQVEGATRWVTEDCRGRRKCTPSSGRK